MKENDTIEIPLSKRTLVKFCLISIAFVAVGAWMLLYHPNTANRVFNDPVTKYGAAIICILFFGFASIFFGIRIFRTKPGFRIDKQGVIDQSSAMAADRILWEDISSFASIEIYGQEYLVINLHNPDGYINKQTNIIKKKAMSYNLQHYGSPTLISIKLLSYNIDTLKRLLRNELVNFKNNNKGFR